MNHESAETFLRVHSHLGFFRRELLHDLFSKHNCEKFVHNPLLNCSVYATVYQKV